ncbi:hypothetical protein BKA62DRAFT_712122 [Auriculariales sp. MPI-PUGE-AT-0066]|nr:hypothetical protein BKA62DRAFT_712122 [Auriculariales sp. MPI-PUGE-AT-0066]
MKVAVKVDNVSPLIEYRGPWVQGSLANDPVAPQYSDNGTFQVAASNEASAVFHYFGGQVSLFGAKRFNHDQFTVTFDTLEPETLNGQSDADQIQTNLYTSPVSAQGFHTLAVQDASTNEDRPYFDLDFLVVESEVNANHSTSVAVDAAAWTRLGFQSSDSGSESGFSSQTTFTAGATATLSFTGTALDLYGMICQQCGLFNISIDGGPQVQLNANNPSLSRTKTVLYVARGLEDTNHTVEMTNLGSGMGLDFAMLYSNSLEQPATGAAPETNQTSGPAPRAQMHIGLIAAAISIPIVCMLVVGLFTCWTRRRRSWPFSPPRGKNDAYAKRSLRNDPEMALAVPRPLILQPAILGTGPPLAYAEPIRRESVYSVTSVYGDPRVVGWRQEAPFPTLPTYSQSESSRSVGRASIPPEKSLH